MIHKLLAGKGRMKRAVSLLLCLALLGGSVIFSNVTAEAGSEVTLETSESESNVDAEGSEETTTVDSAVTETAIEVQTTDSSGSEEETSSDAVTTTSAEEAAQTLTEAVTETNDASNTASVSAEAESSTLSLGSSAATTADEGISLTAISGDTSVTVGSSITLSGSTGDNHSWTYTSSDGGKVSFGNTNSSSVTVTGVTEGTVTITHSYRSGWNTNTETYTITVTAASTIVTVYVFVAGYDYATGEYFSQDMLDLLNVNTLDTYGYFAAGTLELDLSELSGTTTSMITSDEEWAYVLEQLAENLDTSASITCPYNLIASYASQVLTDTGVTQNQGYSGLWLASGHSNITEVSGSAVNGQYWHLDIRFQTVKITYIYGKNGITTSDSSVAYDENTAGSKVFIQGATMNYTPTIEAPEGWKIVGYYTTPDFQEGTEWDAVGQPINEDTTVYIKIVPEDDVVINYVVAEGVGTVTNPSSNNAKAQNGYEYFNPTTGSPVGSTAEAGTGYEFEGWYSDAALTNKVSSDAEYIPSTPTGGWTEGAEYTYYAKFVPVKTTVTVNKVWEDNGNTSLRPSTVTVELYADNVATGTTASITSTDYWTYTFADLNKYSYNDDGTANKEITYTVQETEVEGYKSEVTTATDGSITVTNTLSTATVTIKKVVSGNMGDTSKFFNFTVELSTGGSAYVGSLTYTKNGGEETSDTTNANGEWSISLKHDDYVTVTVPYGYTIVVAEGDYSTDGYTTTYTVDGGGTKNGSSYNNDKITANTTLVFTNDKTVSPPTGLTSDVAPYAAALAIALGGAVLMFVSRRRRV